MKKVILVVGGILLGIALASMLIGNNETSIKKASEDVMKKQIETYKNIP